MLIYLAYFLIFGLIGWVLDTFYRIVISKENTANTFLPYFAIVYGIGGVLLLLLYRHTSLSTAAQILFGGIAATSLEFCAGIFCTRILKHQFWDYSKNKINFFGHIDLTHTIYWFLLAAALHYIQQFLPF